MSHTAEFLGNCQHTCISQDRIYYFRIRVPLALVPLIKGTELRRSLRTSDRADAIGRARVLAVKADLLFERLKAMRKKGTDRRAIRTTR